MSARTILNPPLINELNGLFNGTTPINTSSVDIGVQPDNVLLTCPSAGTLEVDGTVSATEFSVDNGITIPPTLTSLTTANKTLTLSGQLQISNGSTVPVLISSSSTVNSALSIPEIEIPNANPAFNTYITNSNGSVGLSSGSTTSPVVLSQGGTLTYLSVPSANALSITGQLSAQSLEIDSGSTIPATLTASSTLNNTFVISNAVQISNGVNIPPTLSCGTVVNQVLVITGNLQVTGGFLDSTNSPGLNGQIMTSNGTGWYWANP